MRAVLAAITLLAALCMPAEAARRPHPDEVDVVELSGVTFDVALLQRKHVLVSGHHDTITASTASARTICSISLHRWDNLQVEFYSPTCGTCNVRRTLKWRVWAQRCSGSTIFVLARGQRSTSLLLPLFFPSTTLHLLAAPFVFFPSTTEAA
jgi:hypothetical protein